MSRTATSVLSLLCALALTACSPAASPDAGAPREDAGDAEPADAGASSGQDAGEDADDAGHPAGDAGGSPDESDAGPSQDAGDADGGAGDVDAGAGDAGEADAGGYEEPPVETCTATAVLQDSYGSTFTSTLNAGNDFDPGPQGCTGFGAPGNDKLYEVTIPAGQVLALNLQSDEIDASLYVLGSCGQASSTCVIGSDRFGTEVLQLRGAPDADTTHYVVVDSAGGEGHYTLVHELRPLHDDLPLADGCADQPPEVQLPEVGQEVRFDALLTGLADDVTASCTTFLGGGGADGVFRFTTNDEALYTFTAGGRDTKLVLFQGDCGATELQCDDDSGKHGGSRIETVLPAGQTYYLFVDVEGPAQPVGNVEIGVAVAPPF